MSIEKHGVYLFDLAKNELRLTFIDDGLQRKSLFDDADLLDFEQRLGFIQHEEKARELGIGLYLLQLQAYRRSLRCMCELHALGHPAWSLATRTLSGMFPIFI